MVVKGIINADNRMIWIHKYFKSLTV